MSLTGYWLILCKFPRVRFLIYKIGLMILIFRIVVPQMGRQQCFSLEGSFGSYRIRKNGDIHWAGIRGCWPPCGVWDSPTMEDCTMSCNNFQCPQDIHVGTNLLHNYLSLESNGVLHTNIFLHNFKIHWIFQECRLLLCKLREDYTLFCLCFLIKSCSPFWKRKIT